MVVCKKLFFASSLLLSGVAAAPSPVGTLNVAAAEVRAVSDFAIESRGLIKKDTVDAAALPGPPPAKKCRILKRDGLERRELKESHDASNILLDQWVSAIKIAHNGHKATVTDLSGDTALFFYMGTTLSRVIHVFSGNEPVDARQAAKDAAGATSVTIGAAKQENYDAAEKAIKSGRPGIMVIRRSLYSLAKVTSEVAITLTGHDRTTAITEGTGPRVCR